MAKKLKLTQAQSEAHVYMTHWAAMNAAEDYCVNTDGFINADTDAAYIDERGGWIAVVNKKGTDYDQYIAKD